MPVIQVYWTSAVPRATRQQLTRALKQASAEHLSIAISHVKVLGQPRQTTDQPDEDIFVIYETGRGAEGGHGIEQLRTVIGDAIDKVLLGTDLIAELRLGRAEGLWSTHNKKPDS